MSPERASYIRFQFQYGAIGGLITHKASFMCCRISIPVWCDWWSEQLPLTLLLHFISIPVWCDWWQFTLKTLLIRCFISIPVWCDWWALYLSILTSFASISIPVWCDWWLTVYFWPTVLQSFQFQYGAIGGFNPFLTVYVNRIISIPVWCDWWRITKS